MKREDRYILRKEGIPYYYDEIISRTPNIKNGVMPGVSAKIYEIFDGKEVKWGVREEYISIFDYRVCRSTPLFENMVDENGKDKERVIYLGDSKFVFHGKLNNSEVLCRFSDNEDNQFVEIETFGGKDVKITPYMNGTALIETHDDVLPKCYFFDTNKFVRCSNIMDVLYKNNCFLKSYQYGDKVRVIMGRLTYSPIMVRQFGCDVNKDDVILMPLDEYGLLDENEMINYLNKEKKVIGISIDAYKKAISNDFSTTMFNLNVYEFGIMTRMNKYEDYISRSKRR